MGIKSINKTLKDIVPQAFMNIPLSRFSGKAIGIDASLWMFKTKSAAMKDVLRMTQDPLEAMDANLLIESMIKQFYGFIYKLCQFNITPVWIFDGKTHPAKLAADRRKKIKISKKITLEEERERLKNMDPLERVIEIDKFIKGLLGCFCFTKDEENALKEEIISLGIPMFEAPYDGEIFASALSKKRLLIGVWTADTDTYAAGSLSTITGFAKGYSSDGPKVETVVLAVILDQLKISLEQFTDFCILHECDFNEKIPKLGPVTILKKMEKYNWNLDEFIKSEESLPWEKINLEECRDIFKGPDVSEITIEKLAVDKSKWISHMKSKVFEFEPPSSPSLVEVVE